MKTKAFHQTLDGFINYFMINTLKAFIGIFLAIIATNSVQAQLVHPGGWHTQADLTQIRTKVAAEAEPWITGWNAAVNEGPNAQTTTNPSALITSNGAMHNAGFDAWVLTMKWVASGDKSYSDAAINIINTWVDTVIDFDVYGPTLTLSTGAGAMAQAAEVLEHGFNGEAGWNQTQADDAKVWFKAIIYDPWTNTGDFRSANWGTSALGGNMSMAIFMDDESEFEYQRDAYLYGYQDTDDGCAAVTDYIFDDSGQAQESGRDQAHVQGGIAHLTEAALCAWNQGEDLVSVANNRLRAGVEYHAKYNLGYDDLPFTTDIYNPCDIFLISRWDDAISEEYRGQFSPVYYMSSKLFTLAGLDHPYTKEVLTSPGYTPEINNFAHPGLGTFVFIPSSINGGCIDSGLNNLALAGTASMSSEYSSTLNASNLNDNLISNNNDDLAHTGSNASSTEWVQVDLGQTEPIATIAIWNRTNCCQSRLNESYVMVADTPFPSNTDLNAALNNADFVYQLGDVGNIEEIGIDVGLNGQYVRIQRSGNNNDAINIKELQIFALHSVDINNNGICDVDESQCEYDLVMDDTPINGTLYRVQTTIISAGQVSDSSSVTFSAGDDILLVSNFAVDLGAAFLATIQGCDPE